MIQQLKNWYMQAYVRTDLVVSILFDLLPDWSEWSPHICATAPPNLCPQKMMRFPERYDLYPRKSGPRPKRLTVSSLTVVCMQVTARQQFLPVPAGAATATYIYAGYGLWFVATSIQCLGRIHLLQTVSTRLLNLWHGPDCKCGWHPIHLLRHEKYIYWTRYCSRYRPTVFLKRHHLGQHT